MEQLEAALADELVKAMLVDPRDAGDAGKCSKTDVVKREWGAATSRAVRGAGAHA